jgi:hypothetical protein
MCLCSVCAWPQHVAPDTLAVHVLPRHGRLPTAEALLQYDVVVATHERLTAEDRRGGFVFTGVPRACRCTYVGSTRTVVCVCARALPPAYVSPIACVRWRRVVVDEGHVVGHKSGRARFASEKLLAHARWVVTGTPFATAARAPAAVAPAAVAPAAAATAAVTAADDSRADWMRMEQLLAFLQVPLPRPGLLRPSHPNLAQ